jgi:hypothetical protein
VKPGFLPGLQSDGDLAGLRPEHGAAVVAEDAGRSPALGGLATAFEEVAIWREAQPLRDDGREPAPQRPQPSRRSSLKSMTSLSVRAR